MVAMLGTREVKDTVSAAAGKITAAAADTKRSILIVGAIAIAGLLVAAAALAMCLGSLAAHRAAAARGRLTA